MKEKINETYITTLLARAEPKKPEEEPYMYGVEYLCPICHKHICWNYYQQYSEQHFCSNCGQALKWEI